MYVLLMNNCRLAGLSSVLKYLAQNFLAAYDQSIVWFLRATLTTRSQGSRLVINNILSIRTLILIINRQNADDTFFECR